jgi:hypothetical protein
VAPKSITDLVYRRPFRPGRASTASRDGVEELANLPESPNGQRRCKCDPSAYDISVVNGPGNVIDAGGFECRSTCSTDVQSNGPERAAPLRTPVG